MGEEDKSKKELKITKEPTTTLIHRDNLSEGKEEEVIIIKYRRDNKRVPPSYYGSMEGGEDNRERSLKNKINN